MALQGTIDTFPLTDVLALLEASAKSGLLTLTGARGSGDLWLDGQNILGGTLDGDTSLNGDRLLFELLRFDEGSFEFSSAVASEFPTFDGAPMSISVCVDSAEKMLLQWKRIESIVPSTGHRVSLAPQLPGGEVTVDAELWTYLVAVSNAATVGAAADLLELDMYDGSAVIASLVDQGLVEVGPPVGEGSADPADTVVDTSAPAPEEKAKWDPDEVADDEDPHADSTLIEDLKQEETMWEEPANNFPERFPIDDLLLDDADGQDDPWGSSITGPINGVSADGDATDGAIFTGLPDLDPVPLGGFQESAPGGAHPNGSGLKDWDEMVNMEPLSASVASPDPSADETTDEVLRQMSKLSPKAAEAIAAALGSAGDDGQKASSGDDTTGLGPVSFLDSF